MASPTLLGHSALLLLFLQFGHHFVSEPFLDITHALVIELCNSPFTMQAVFAFLAVVSAASAHATWQEFWVGTQDQAGSCVRTVQDNSPIVSVTDATMACGRGPKAATGVCTAAGALCPPSPNFRINTALSTPSPPSCEEKCLW